MTAPAPRHRCPRRGPTRRRGRAASATVAATVLVTAAALATSAARQPGSPPATEAPATEAPTDAPSPRPTPVSPATPAVPTDGPAPSATPNPPVDVPDAGSGSFVIAPTTEPPGAAVPEGRPPRDTRHYTVEVEGELPFAPEDVAAFVDDALRDERGWSSVLPQRFERVADDQDLRVLLASPATTDRLCAPLQTNGEVSCRNGDRVVLNARRWARGVPDYAGDLTGYRTYLVNHEVGHALGEPHRPCPGAGAPAPTMQQQTYGLDGCRANGWPTVG
ncbi:DUF3152 domain-containing protein [Nocardioides zeae]